MQNQTRFIKRGLKWFSLLLFLLPGVSAWADPLCEIPFKSRGGLIWIQVNSPQSAKPLNFILDSGAEASVIDLPAAQRLHLALGKPVTIRGVNATTLGYWPEHLSARLGGVSLPTNYVAMDLSVLSAACQHGVDGLLGADFFAGRVVQIDFAKHKIRLLEDYQPGSAAEVLPLQVESSRLRVPIEVEGFGKAWARLDTGCASALHWAVSPTDFAGKYSSQELGVGISSQLIRHHTKTVHLGQTTLKEVSTGLQTEQLLAGEAGLLGSGLLSQFSLVTIDEPAGQLVLEAPFTPKPSGSHR
jgi:hypothetical protein